MEQLLEKKLMPTVSLKTARIYVDQLRSRNDDLASEVAAGVQGRITVAELSGQSRVDLDLAILDSMEVDASIDALVDLVIDLR
ncbi:MAG: hypothetical protein HKN03_11130 [Acidimicrobiales bacterium]|nr:hypothetical protein [Acidimicrobiales bacterium]